MRAVAYVPDSRWVARTLGRLASLICPPACVLSFSTGHGTVRHNTQMATEPGPFRHSRLGQVFAAATQCSARKNVALHPLLTRSALTTSRQVLTPTRLLRSGVANRRGRETSGRSFIRLSITGCAQTFAFRPPDLTRVLWKYQVWLGRLWLRGLPAQSDLRLRVLGPSKRVVSMYVRNR